MVTFIQLYYINKDCDIMNHILKNSMTLNIPFFIIGNRTIWFDEIIDICELELDQTMLLFDLKNMNYNNNLHKSIIQKDLYLLNAFVELCYKHM